MGASALELEIPPDEISDGLFDPFGRAAAISSCLPLLATYFVAGEAWTLTPQAALLAGDDDVDRALARAVRLRVLLALAQELGVILRTITEQPSFKYGRRSDESVGVIAGRLDVASYLRNRGYITAPRRYPIKIVERQIATPENVLASAALQTLIDGLDSVPVDVLPRTGGPERRAIEERRAALARTSQLPLFVALGPLGRSLARHGYLGRQREFVLRRLNRREIAQPDVYAALAEWVRRCLEGAAAAPGDARWSFYDRRFDARLFEIWGLSELATALAARFGAPIEGRVRPLWLRDDKPRATWQTTYGRVELYFQRDARGLGLRPRWGIRSRGHVLGAVPDITVRMLSGGSEFWCVLDCKLRRRDPLPASDKSPLDLPVEEVYKMLGYFEHLSLSSRPVGALLYYTPGAARSELLERVNGDGEQPADGLLLLAGVDPSVEDQNQAVFQRVADLIGRELGEPPEEVREEAERISDAVVASGGDALEAAAAKKARLFREVVNAWADHHPLQRETVESTTRASFRAVDWESLDAETRRMLVSAEVYAIHQPEEMDYSGPLLVLCAACERELNLRFFLPLAGTLPAPQSGQRVSVPQHPTLGQALFLLRHGLDLALARKKGQMAKADKIIAAAATPDDAAMWIAVAERLLESAQDLTAVGELVERLYAINKRYRRIAAHDATVDREKWVLGRGQLLGANQAVHHIARAFPRSAAEGESS